MLRRYDLEARNWVNLPNGRAPVLGIGRRRVLRLAAMLGVEEHPAAEPNALALQRLKALRAPVDAKRLHLRTPARGHFDDDPLRGIVADVLRDLDVGVAVERVSGLAVHGLDAANENVDDEPFHLAGLRRVEA